tara:strand:- start:404 stop:1495 length:1092 start_codon:yes stop_codon:yes gene_type:complete
MDNTLTQIIKIARPKSSDSSIKTYIRLIQKIKVGTPKGLNDAESYEWIDDLDPIKEYFILNQDKIKTESTKRNYYVALMIYIEGINGGDHHSNEWSINPSWLYFNNEVNAINKKYMDKQKSGNLTESQTENMAEKKDILKMINDLKKLLPSNPSLHVPYVLFSIYMELPVRNEIATLKIIKKGAYNKMINDTGSFPNDSVGAPSSFDNYLMIDKNQMFIIRNSYKTSASKNGGTKTDELSKPLKRIINAYIKTLGPDALKYDSTALDSENYRLFPTLYPKPDKDGNLPSVSTPELNLTKLLTRTTEKYLDGKKISTTILAKLTSADLIANTPAEEVPQQLIKISDKRGTSLNNLVPIYTNNNV